MDRVVLDTNIFISGIAIASSSSGHIINAWRENTFVLVISPQILTEIREVLLRPTIMNFTGLSKDEVNEFIFEIEQRSYVTEGTYEVTKIQTDPDDNDILACALEGYATHIVTGDTKSLLPLKDYHGIRILTPTDYMRQRQV